MKSKNRLYVSLSVLLPALALFLDYYIIGPAVADAIGFSAARYLLLAFGLLFLVTGVLLILKNSGKYKLLCIPSMIASMLFFFGYYVAGFLQGI